MKISDWIRTAETALLLEGIDSARLEAQVLAAHVLGKDRTWILTNPEAELDEEKAALVLKRRLTHEPLAYILGYREFYGRKFRVGPGVLIPRQESETLIEAALSHLKADDNVLDIGTGSGCLSITIALERPDVNVQAIDISVNALKYAIQNAAILGANLRFEQADLFAWQPEIRFDLIACNPPYISTKERLEKQVGEYEPHEALFAGEDALAFYRLLADKARELVTGQGVLLLEIGRDQEKAIEHIFKVAEWNLCESNKDLAGVVRVLGFVLS